LKLSAPTHPPRPSTPHANSKSPISTQSPRAPQIKGTPIPDMNELSCDEVI